MKTPEMKEDDRIQVNIVRDPNRPLMVPRRLVTAQVSPEAKVCFLCFELIKDDNQNQFVNSETIAQASGFTIDIVAICLMELVNAGLIELES